MGHGCRAELEKSECLERGEGTGEGQGIEPLGVGFDEGFGELNWLPMKKKSKIPANHCLCYVS